MSAFFVPIVKGGTHGNTCTAGRPRPSRPAHPPRRGLHIRRVAAYTTAASRALGSTSTGLEQARDAANLRARFGRKLTAGVS
jgi:hypothetical protein